MYYNHDGEPLNLWEWAQLQEIEEYRRVDYTEFYGWYVSTIWVGLDQSFGRGGIPLIFETMILNSTDGSTPELEDVMWRTATYAEAQAAHAHAVELVREHLLPTTN